MDDGDAVPLMRPVLPPPEKLEPRLRVMHQQGWFSNFGPMSRELEAEVARRLEVSPDHVVSVANATLGLVGALATARASRWSLPSWTFTATAAAVMLSGRDARFLDVDEKTWWMRPPVHEGRASEGVLTVAPYGVGFGAEVWCGDDVIVDAAASLGADHRLDAMPPTGVVVYSMHATKVLGAGEGGIVVLGDADRAARLRAWTNFGFTESRDSRFPGINAKLSEPAAILALAALDGWPEEREEWWSARRRADELTNRHGLVGAPGLTGQVSPYWVVQLPDRRSREVVERVLSKQGVATRRWWGEGCHQMAAYRAIARGPLPVTEHLADTVLGLPMFRGLSAKHADRIDSALDAARKQAAW